MHILPTPAVLAELAGDAIQMLYDKPVAFGGECPSGSLESANGGAVMVPLIGERLYVLRARANAAGGLALACIMFDCSAADATQEMIEDSLRELINILAGQVKSGFAMEYQIGLPGCLDGDRSLGNPLRWSGARLNVGGHIAEVDIVLMEYARPAR